ncbi:MAG TPA: hypothetical protein GX392_01645 [Clostridiales bacterium]|nr:hypothetical protein [Clostridiales bacterium]
MTCLECYFKKNKISIGACEGDNKVVLCQIRTCNNGIAVEDIICFEGTLTLIEKKMLYDYNLGKTKINVVLPSELIIQSYLELPYMNSKNIIQYIEYELHRLYDIDADLYRFSYFPLGLKPNNENKFQRILAMGLPIADMKQYKIKLNRLGFRTVSFISPLEARLMILRHIDAKIGKGVTLCLIYIDETVIDIFFYWQNDIISTAHIKLPKKHLDKELIGIFDYFSMEYYDKIIHSIILTGNCNVIDKYIDFFKELGYTAIWLDGELLGISPLLKDECDLPAFYIDALGAALYL